MCVCACVFLCFPVSMETKLDTCIYVHVYTRTNTYMHGNAFVSVQHSAFACLKHEVHNVHTHRSGLHPYWYTPAEPRAIKMAYALLCPVDLHTHMHAVKHFESYSIVSCCPKVSDDSTKTDGFSRVCKCVYASDCVHFCRLKVFFTLIYLDKNFNLGHFNQIFTWPAIGGVIFNSHCPFFVSLFLYQSVFFSADFSDLFLYIHCSVFARSAQANKA